MLGIYHCTFFFWYYLEIQVKTPVVSALGKHSRKHWSLSQRATATIQQSKVEPTGIVA